MGTVEFLKEIYSKGFAKLTSCFSERETLQIKGKLRDYIAQNQNGVVYEPDGVSIRAVQGPHLYESFFDSLCRNKTLVGIASSYLGEPCYIHQFKVNFKKKMVGQPWPWHEDFVYWKNKDGIELPKMINFAILLDPVEHLSGPICFIPKTHVMESLTDIVKGKGDWEQDVSKELTYQISSNKIAQLITDYGVEYALGEAGDVVAFDPRIAHCSASNMSPTNRAIAIITYNAASNTPKLTTNVKRPEFMSAYNTQPIN